MDSIVLSTRVRLARNLNNYPFIPKLNKEDAKKIINDIENTENAIIKTAPNILFTAEPFRSLITFPPVKK